MQRRIGKFETAPAVANAYACFNLVGILKLENAPSPGVVQSALDVLQSYHPALRTRMEKTRNSFRFHKIEGRKIPLLVEERTGEDQWRPHVEKYLDTPVDWASGPLLHCTYLRASGVSEIIFAFHHSIVDAISLVTFLDDFLKLCAAAQTGEGYSGFEAYPALPAVEELFPWSFRGLPMQLRTMGFMMRQMASEMAIMRKSKGKRKPLIHTEVDNRVLVMDLSEEETTALVKKARKQKVTLNSVQHAAILTASWKHLYHSEAMPLKYILFQNLRPYLTTPQDEKVLGSYIAMLQLAVDMDPAQDFWALCRKINEAVHRTGKTGDKFISANMSGTLLKMLFRYKSFRMATTAMNYSGAISLQPAYGDIQVLDVRGFASNFGLGPEFSAQTILYKGKLSWNIVYLETDMNAETAQAITDEIRQILVSQAEEG